jgi:hypothetical protein
MFDVQSTEMRYLDASAKPDEKHTYSVITVNAVGLNHNRPFHHAS